MADPGTTEKGTVRRTDGIGVPDYLHGLFTKASDNCARELVTLAYRFDHHRNQFLIDSVDF